MKTHRKFRSRGRALLAWTAALLVTIQIAVSGYMECTHPEVYDPEYRDRLVVLKRCVAESPRDPLLLIVGSSRITTDVRPEVLGEMRTPAGEKAVPFNFSHTGSGPLLNLTLLHRLERQGHVPRWVVLEMVPSLLGASGQSMAARVSLAGDLPLMSRYMPRAKLYSWYAWERMNASWSHRHAYTRQCAPALLYLDATWDMMPLGPLGGSARFERSNITVEEMSGRVAGVKAEYFGGLQHLKVAEAPNRATREFIEFCGQRGIPVVLLLTPESSTFRGWYTEETQRVVRDYCDTLRNEYDVPIVDSREWLADDRFVDGHHLFVDAAAEFTTRLQANVLQPLVEGQWNRGAK